MTQINDLNQGHSIIKYPNRKLYNTTLSRYITLTSSNVGEITIETLLKANIPIKVVDNRTGLDITDKTIGGVVNGLLRINPNLSSQVYDFINNLTNEVSRENTNV